MFSDGRGASKRLARDVALSDGTPHKTASRSAASLAARGNRGAKVVSPRAGKERRSRSPRACSPIRGRPCTSPRPTEGSKGRRRRQRPADGSPHTIWAHVRARRPAAGSLPRRRSSCRRAFARSRRARSVLQATIPSGYRLSGSADVDWTLLRHRIAPDVAHARRRPAFCHRVVRPDASWKPVPPAAGVDSVVPTSSPDHVRSAGRATPPEAPRFLTVFSCVVGPEPSLAALFRDTRAVSSVRLQSYRP